VNTPLLLLDTQCCFGWIATTPSGDLSAEWPSSTGPDPCRGSMRGVRSAAPTHRSVRSEHVQRPSAAIPEPAVSATVGSSPAATPLLDLTDFKRDLSELTDRLGQAQDCL
jgi:peptide chain release factor 2